MAALSQRGITVLELLIVVGLLASLTAMAAFGYGRALAGWRLNAAARQVVMDVKLARLRAMSEGVDRRLRFRSGATDYQAQRRTAAGVYADDGPPVLLPGGVLVVGCTGAGASVSFRPRGYAGAFGTITLSDPDQRQRRVIVDIVGRARIE